MITNRDDGYTADRWAFDDEVTRVFDDMLERSIPQYQAMRDLVTNLGGQFLPTKERGMVVDLGTSRGDQIAHFIEEDQRLGRNIFYWGWEISPPMVEAAQRRFDGMEENVCILEADLRKGLKDASGSTYSWGGMCLVTAVLTMMFIPAEHRQRLMQEIYDALLPGGAYIMVEKILGAGATIDEAMVAEYYKHKARTGYDEDAIQRKRFALEGVLVPSTASTHMEDLRAVGFTKIDCFWRWMNFAGFIAVK
tara:strand:- start:3198 stop:3947 length:750 start_codon:yes stop_codon:yes gene_type:complete